MEYKPCSHNVQHNYMGRLDYTQLENLLNPIGRASARPPSLTLASCDLDVWPADLTPKIERLMPLSHGPLMPIWSKIGSFVSEISCWRDWQWTDGRTDGPVAKHFMPPASLYEGIVMCPQVKSPPVTCPLGQVPPVSRPPPPLPAHTIHNTINVN